MCVHVCAFSCVSFLWYHVSVCDAVCLAVCMCMCACAHKCARPRACERGAVCVCDVADVDISKRAHVCARAVRRQSHLTASAVYESSEGEEESTYDDCMGLEHLCATDGVARAHAR